MTAPSTPEEAEAVELKEKGNSEYKNGDYEAAVECYTKAIKKASSSILHSNRAAAYMMLGWWDQALRDTKVALRKDPANSKALDRQGRCLVCLDRFDEALKVADEIERRSPKPKNSGEPPLPVWRLRWLVSICKTPESLEECRSALKELGSKENLLSPLGARLKIALTRALLHRADVLQEEDPQLAACTASAEEALKLTAELLEDSPEDADVRYLRSRALAQLGRHDDAQAQARRGLKENPEHQELRDMAESLHGLEEFKQRGNQLYKDGRFLESIQVYSAGLEKDPACVDAHTCAELYYNRSAAYRRHGEFAKALEDANTALALHPRWAKALYRRGIALLECGRPAEALQDLKTVQRTDPTLELDLEDWIRRAHNFLGKPKDSKMHYQFMRLPLDATREEIKRQYRKLCLQWHPDKNQTEEAASQYSELQASYNFLMDEEQREEYDYGRWKQKDVKRYASSMPKFTDIDDDNHNEAMDVPWIERTREGKEFVEKQLAEQAKRYPEPDWLEKSLKQLHKRWHSLDVA
mmetsp:Transcript_43940/g.79013  ORF Transcript_43940/g.79013 Transcript_43940/m.79013 type:complete len:527 (-) Transcript_43940:116-1696(-)